MADIDELEVFGACRMSNGGPCPPCREHMALDAQISATKQSIRNLITQQREVRTKVNSLRDPITRHFPREIVSTIFDFGLSIHWPSSMATTGIQIMGMETTTL